MTHFGQTHVTEKCHLRSHSSFLQVGLSVCALCCLLISEDLLTFHARQSTNFLGFCSSEKSLLLLHPSLKNGILNVAQAGLVLLGSSYLPPSSLQPGLQEYASVPTCFTFKGSFLRIQTGFSSPFQHSKHFIPLSSHLHGFREIQCNNSCLCS